MTTQPTETTSLPANKVDTTMPAPKKVQTIEQLLSAENTINQIKRALPKHLSADRMSRIALTELRLNPKLRECDPYSFLGAILKCSQLGLEPGTSLGHVSLIPFKQECNVIIGYRGMIDLALRSGKILTIEADIVCENDVFEYQKGTSSFLKHVPALRERGPMIGVYAGAVLNKLDFYRFEIMSKEEVDAIRNSSPSRNHGPWVTHYHEMAKKTAIRKLFKYLPVSTAMTEAIILDERADAGVQENASVGKNAFDYDASTGEIHE